MPTLNSAVFIREAINSIASQTYENYEVLIVDSGSTDETLKICREFGDKFQVLQLLGSRQGRARNHGIAKAKASHVLFLDSDDKFASNQVLEMCKNTIREYSAEIYNFGVKFLRSGKVVKCIENKSNFRVDGSSELTKLALSGRFIHTIPWNKVYNRDFLEKNSISFPPLEEQEDMLFVLKLASTAKTMMFLSEVIVHADVRAESLSRALKEKNVTCCIEVFQTFKEWMSKKGFPDVKESDFNFYKLRTTAYLLLRLIYRVKSNAEFQVFFDKLTGELSDVRVSSFPFRMFLSPKFWFCILLAKFKIVGGFLRWFRPIFNPNFY